MATTKTIQPTGTTITIPAMSDKPDISVLSTDIERITDSVNALNSKLTIVTATYTFNNVGAGTGLYEQVQLPVPSGKTLLMASVYQTSGLNLAPVWIKSVGSSSATVMVWNGRTSEASIGVTVVGLCW